MASVPFEVTDDNGITVRGSVEVSRDPKGDFYNPGSRYLGNPRYAEFHIVYSNTREACTIDRDKLSEAVQKALGEALEKFGIAGANPGSIRDRVNREIDATRQQCAANADKYVSSDGVDSSMRGNSAQYAASPNIPQMEQILRLNGEENSTSADSGPLRYLSSRFSSRPQPSESGHGMTAPPLVPFDENFDPRQAAAGDRFGDWIGSSPAVASRGASAPGMPLVGLVSGKPMSFHPVQPPLFGFPEPGARDDEDWLLQLLAPRRGG